MDTVGNRPEERVPTRGTPTMDDKPAGGITSPSMVGVPLVGTRSSADTTVTLSLCRSVYSVPLVGTRSSADTTVTLSLCRSVYSVPLVGTRSSADTAEGEVFEIFQQDQKDPFPHHGGNLRAPDGELAIHYAKEFYGRRQESQKLWIVPRTALWEISDTTSPHPSLHALTDEDAVQEGTSQTFAVFGQKQAGKPLVWLQDLEEMSLLAAAEAAVQLAYRSEGGYLRLWLCPRSAISELTNPDLLQPPLDRSYRRLDGYNIREKLRQARQRVQAQGEKLP